MIASGLALCWLFFSGKPDFQSYDPTVFQLHAIKNMTSPTGLLVNKGRLFLSADHLDPRPGLYSLHKHPKEGYRAGLLQILPQQSIQGLNMSPTGSFRLISDRLFSTHPADWVSQVVLLSANQYNLLDIWKPDIPNECNNGQRHCGLVGLVNLPDGSMIAVTRKGPARLYRLQKVSGEWQVLRSWPLTVKGRYVTVSDLMYHNGSLIFLVKNKWMLASLDPAVLGERPGKYLELNPVFEFAHLGKSMRVGSVSFLYAGLAEAFAFDEGGQLLVVLNNKGYTFDKSPDQVLDERPKLLVFPPVKADSDKKSN